MRNVLAAVVLVFACASSPAVANNAIKILGVETTPGLSPDAAHRALTAALPRLLSCAARWADAGQQENLESLKPGVPVVHPPGADLRFRVAFRLRLPGMVSADAVRSIHVDTLQGFSLDKQCVRDVLADTAFPGALGSDDISIDVMLAADIDAATLAAQRLAIQGQHQRFCSRLDAEAKKKPREQPLTWALAALTESALDNTTDPRVRSSFKEIGTVNERPTPEQTRALLVLLLRASAASYGLEAMCSSSAAWKRLTVPMK